MDQCLNVMPSQKLQKKNMALVRPRPKEGSKTSSEAVAHKKTKPVMYEVKI